MLGGGTAMTPLIPGLRGQVVGGGVSYECTVYNRVKGHVWGGYCNDATYSGIERPGCGGGVFSYECTVYNGVKGHVWGGYHNDATYSGIERPGCGGEVL